MSANKISLITWLNTTGVDYYKLEITEITIKMLKSFSSAMQFTECLSQPNQSYHVTVGIKSGEATMHVALSLQRKEGIET